MAVWLPIFGNVINGVGHYTGYRNFDTKDESRNIIPLGLWIVGEELHNNHHADPRSAKFKAKWYEFDVGWVYIRLLSAVRLAKVIYARNVSAVEFREKYYKRASDAAAEVSATAGAAARRAQVAAGDAAKRAQVVAGDAAKRAHVAAGDAAKRAHVAAGDAARRAQLAAEAAGEAAAEVVRPTRPAVD
jgi:hypothetical protein